MVSIMTATEHRRVPSLTPHLRRSLDLGMTMNQTAMRPEDVATCAWVGFGIGKGVTHPVLGLTRYAVPNELRRGIHAELLADRIDVDPYPRCYDLDGHDKGFGAWVRWVYFADPDGGPGVFGIDFSLACRATSGVATTMLTVATIVRAAVADGILADAEVALLNPQMCEEPALCMLRHGLGLVIAGDWIAHASSRFGLHGAHCPRCGLATRTHDVRYCNRCGCKFAMVRAAHMRRAVAAAALDIGGA